MKKRISVPNCLANNLIVLRNRVGMSQEAFVLDLNVYQGVIISRAAYSKYEEGRSEPKIITLKAVADYYTITIDELCFNELTN